MMHGRSYSQNVGRRSGTPYGAQSRNDFIRNNVISQMPCPPPNAQGQQATARFTNTYESGWSLGSNQSPPQPQRQQQQPPNYSPSTSGPAYRSATPVQMNTSPGNGSQPMAMPQVSVSTGQGVPTGLEGNPNVKYVNLNWEDILGGKEGMKGMRVSMAPQSGGDGTQNRQLQISFGSPGGENQPPSDGSVPLKVLSFEPVKNYPGQMGNSQASALSGRAATPIPPPGRQYNTQAQRPGQYSPMGQLPQRVASNPNYSAQQQGYSRQTNGGFGPGSKGNCNCASCQFKQPYRQR